MSIVAVCLYDNRLASILKQILEKNWKNKFKERIKQHNFCLTQWRFEWNHNKQRFTSSSFLNDCGFCVPLKLSLGSRWKSLQRSSTAWNWFRQRSLRLREILFMRRILGFRHYLSLSDVFRWNSTGLRLATFSSLQQMSRQRSSWRKCFRYTSEHNQKCKLISRLKIRTHALAGHCA